MNRFSLESKRALVTGGATGIGFAIARAFADAGASVVISGRRESVLADAVASLGAKCTYHVMDVANLAEISPAVQSIESQHGPIDILVNNAGINLKKPMLEMSDEEFAKIQQTNLAGVFALSREVVRSMSNRNRGCILNITSMAAMYGIPKVAAYTAAKTGVVGLTREMAVELAAMGIRVNSIAPGFIFSEMTARALDADPPRKARVMARTPMNRMGEPDEVASAAVFLCSDAASFITGVNLPVDGGNSIGF